MTAPGRRSRLTAFAAPFTRLDADRRRLVLSLVFNLATRLPGVVGVLFFLPLMRSALDVDGFGVMMAALALGTSITFLTGGFGVIGRRLVGAAHGADDRPAEADAARSLFDASAIGFAAMAAIAIGYGVIRGGDPAFVALPLLMSLVAFGLQFDSLRAAYNEHYVTASALIVAQLAIFGVAFLVPPGWFTPTLGGCVIQLPQLAASLWAGATLLARRPYLRRGRPTLVRPILVQGLWLGFGDGLIMASLGMALVYLQATGTAGDAAWFAAATRVFMIVLAPMLLLLAPLSSYVRIIWDRQSPARQRRLIWLSVVVSAGYSLLVGIALYAASALYVEGVLRLPPPERTWVTISVFVLFAAILAFKSYTAISIIVLDAHRFSREIAVSALAVLLLSAAATTVLAPIAAIGVYAALLSAAIAGLVVHDVRRFRRSATHIE